MMSRIMEAELRDLRNDHDEALLRRAYDELYLATFIDPDEQETFEQYRSRLFDAQQPPPQPVTHFVVAGRSLSPAADAELLGFIIFESYRESACGLLTYVVTVPAARGQGLARRLIAFAQETLARDMAAWHGRPHALAAIFAEMHDPQLVSAADDVMDPAARLEVMRRFGAAQLPIRYVQPELVPGGERSRQLLLTMFPLTGATPQVQLESGVVLRFLREFYRALGVPHPERDPDYLAMQRDVDRAVHGAPPEFTSPLPWVRLVETNC
jgi:GNAT superfamily N-acetyltransferase